FFFFQAEDGIRDFHVTGVQTCALPIYASFLKSFMSHSSQYKDICFACSGSGHLGGILPWVALASICGDLRHDEPDARIFHHAPRSEERRVGKEWRGRRGEDGGQNQWKT